jgi:hypothetical protein
MPRMASGRDVPDATFACPDLTTFTRRDELGLEVIGQRVEPDCAVLACRVVGPDDSAGWCRRCGREGVPHDSGTRRLAYEPFGWRPTTLLVTVRRYRRTGCGHVWRQDTSRAAEPRARLSRRGLRWALEGIVVQHLTVARVADGLGVSQNTANDAVLTEGRRVLINDPGRFDGVAVVAFAVKTTLWPFFIFLTIPAVTFLAGWMIYRQHGDGQDNSPGHPERWLTSRR